MSGQFEVVITGLSALDNMQDIPANVTKAAVLSLNAAVRKSRRVGADAILGRINFPKDYLSESGDRLTIAKFATAGDKEAIVRARPRATSLARFATTSLQPGRRGGISVSVKPGNSELLKRAFAVRLRAGSANLDTKSNMGLAIRLRPGEKLANKNRMVRLTSSSKSSAYLLYGPSVDQVFRTVSAEMVPEIELFLEDEFLRLLDVNL